MWAKALKCEIQDINSTTSFVDLGGESLAFVILIDMLEQQFGDEFDFFDLGMGMTIKDITERMEQ
jgi:acyl carrier protein